MKQVMIDATTVSMKALSAKTLAQLVDIGHKPAVEELERRGRGTDGVRPPAASEELRSASRETLLKWQGGKNKSKAADATAELARRGRGPDGEKKSRKQRPPQEEVATAK